MIYLNPTHMASKQMFDFLISEERLYRRRQAARQLQRECREEPNHVSLSKWLKIWDKLHVKMEAWSEQALKVYQAKHEWFPSKLPAEYRDMCWQLYVYQTLHPIMNVDPQQASPEVHTKIKHMFDTWDIKSGRIWDEEKMFSPLGLASLIDAAFEHPQWSRACQESPFWSRCETLGVFEYLNHPKARLWWIKHSVKKGVWIRGDSAYLRSVEELTWLKEHMPSALKHISLMHISAWIEGLELPHHNNRRQRPWIRGFECHQMLQYWMDHTNQTFQWSTELNPWSVFFLLSDSWSESKMQYLREHRTSEEYAHLVGLKEEMKDCLSTLYTSSCNTITENKMTWAIFLIQNSFYLLDQDVQDMWHFALALGCDPAAVSEEGDSAFDLLNSSRPSPLRAIWKALLEQEKLNRSLRQPNLQDTHRSSISSRTKRL